MRRRDDGAAAEAAPAGEEEEEAARALASCGEFVRGYRSRFHPNVRLQVRRDRARALASGGAVADGRCPPGALRRRSPSLRPRRVQGGRG